MAINVRADIEASQKKKKKIDVKADIARTAAPKVTTSKKDKSYTGVDAEINRREASRSARYSMQPEVRAAEIKRAEARGDTKRASELKKATDIEQWAKEQVNSDFVRSRAQTVYDNEFNAAKLRGDQSPAVAAEHAAQGYLDLFRNKPQETRNETYAYRQAEKLQEAANVFGSNDFGKMSESGKLIGVNLDGNLPKSRFEKIITFVNNDPYRNSIEALAIMNHGDSNLAKQISQLTEDEKKIIRYYAARGEKDKVEEFYKLMERELNARIQTKKNKETYEEAYEKPILGAVKNVAGTMAAPAGYVANAGNAIANVFRDDYIPTDYNTPAFSGAHMAEQTSAGVTKRASDAAGGGAKGEIASLLAGTGLSIANQLVTLPMGAAGSLAYMSAEAAGQTTLDALKRGASAEQALFLSTAAGAIEAMTEKIPLDNLFKVADEVGEKGLKNFIKTVIKEAPKQGITEAGEEIVSEIANTIMDIAVMKDKSGYEQYIAELMQNGMSRAEAEKEALIGYLGKNVLMAGAGGLISGIAMGSGAATVSHARGAIQSRNAGVAEGEAGFTKNEYSEKVSNKTIRALDAIGKKLGVNIQIGAPTGTGAGAYNGYYENGTIVIAQDAENPLEVVLSHEVTHHMKTAAPAEYAKFAELAINASTKLEGTAKADLISRYRQSYAEGTQTDFTDDAAIDEITADYASKLVNDVETFRELVRADKTVAERFIESVKEFIAKVKTTFSKDKTKADTASLEKYGATVSELEAAVKTYEDMIKTTQTAVASGQFGIENTAENPTSNPDIHFSLKEPVEETKRLVALHNLTAEKLLKALKMGGFPMPSIAVTKPDSEYANFGDISLVMNKSTVDPQANRNNAVYSADAWTPTYPRVDYEVNPEAETRLSKKYYDLAGRFGRDAVQALYSYGNTLEETLNRSGGAEGIISRLKDDTKMMNVYLLDVGKSQVEDVYKETTTRLSDAEIEEYDFIVNGLGEDVLNETYPADGESPMTTRKKWIEAHGEKLVKVYEEYLSSVGLSEEEVANVMRNSDYDAKRLLRDVVIPARNYLKNGAEKTTREYDSAATEEAIRNAVDTKAYESWLQENFGDIELGQGIYNGKDYFTPSGQRRSFAALHYAHTLENVVKAMMEKGRKGLGGFGGGNIFGASAVEYDSIETMKDDAEKRLTNLPQEEYDAIREGFSDRFFEIASSLPKNKESFHAVDDAANMLIEAVLKYKTKSGMANYLRKESEGWANYYDYIVDDLIELVDEIRKMPVGYFEAKPERAVGFDEVLAAVLPSDTSEELKAQLKETGIEVLTYEKGNAEDRKAKVNSVNNAQFSLKKRKPNTDNQGRELSAEQAEYFKDSKVRDKDGALITVYHGTGAGFNVFENRQKRTRGSLSFGEGYYFTPSKAMAENYADGDSPRIIEAYLNIQNPYEVFGTYFDQDDYKKVSTELGGYSVVNKENITENLKRLGYDGVIARSYNGTDNPILSVVAFESSQIKNIDNENPTTNPDIRYSLKSGAAASNDSETYKSILDVAKEDSYATVTELKSYFESGSAEYTMLEDLEKRGYGSKNAHNLMRRLIDKGKRATRATASTQAETALTSSGSAETLTTNDGKTTSATDILPTIRKIVDYAVDNKKATVSELKKKFERGSEARKLLISYIKKGYGKENAYQFIKEIEESILRERRRVQPATAPTPAPVTETETVAEVAAPEPVEVEVETANEEEPEPVVEEPPKVSEPEPAPEEIPEATSAEDEESYIRDTGLDGYFEDIHERAQTAQDKRIRDAERALMSTPERQKKTMREKVKESRDFLKRKIENSGAALRDIAKKTKDKSLYPIYNRARGAMNIVSDMITNKQTNIRGEKVGESLEGIIAPIKEKGAEYFRDFQLYLLHKHNVARMSLRDTKAEEIAKTDLEIFIRDNPGIAAMGETELERASQWDDAKGIKAKQYIELRERLNRLQNTKNKPIFFDNDEVPLSAAESRRAAEELLKKNPGFTEDEAKIRTYLDNLMQYRVDTGLITQQEADYFKKKYPDYIPTYRDTESVQKQLQGKLNIGKTVGKARGGNDPILPLDVALAEMTKKVVRNGQKNIFANKVFSLYDKHSKLLERYITDVQEGKVDTDAEIDGFGEERADDNTVTFHNDGKRIELTVTPELYEAFAEMSKILKEQAPVADWWRKINNGYKKLITTYDPTFIIRNGIKDLQDAIINSRDTKAMLKNLPKAYVEIANGGEMFELYRSMGGLHSSRFEEIKTKGVEKKSWAKKLPDALAFGNMMVEQAPRLAEFMSVLEKGDRNDLDVLAEALYAAADVTTNFGESGTWGKVLNAYYVPFLNPAIQGTAKIGRLITEPKTAKQWYGLAAKAVIMGVGAGFINDILIGMFGDDEEKEAYENLQERVKDNYFLIPTDDGKFAKIPKGRIAASLGVIADRVRDVAKGEKVSAGEALVRILENIAPENPITNNIFSPFIEADLFNNESKGRTWYGGDIESDSLQGLPAGERFDSSTDYFSKYAGKALGLSPKKINYILKQYTGGAGRTILPMITPSEQKGDTIAGVIGYGALSILTSNFMVDSKLSNKVSGEFYDAVSETEQKKNSSKGTLADKVVYKHLNRERNQMSGYNKKIREAETDRSLTSKERDVAVRAATASRTEYQKEVIDNLGKYRKNVEKYLKEYPGKDEEKKIDYAYRKANYATYGAEYAIRVNGGKSVYEKAAEKVKRGKTTWEEYYEEYFGRDERRYELLRDKYDISYAEYEKIAEAMSKNSTEEEEIEALHKLGYKRSTARGIRRNFNKVK